jgi:hypothetical protein
MEMRALIYLNSLHCKRHSRLHVQHSVHGRKVPLPDEAELSIVLQRRGCWTRSNEKIGEAAE